MLLVSVVCMCKGDGRLDVSAYASREQAWQDLMNFPNLGWGGVTHPAVVSWGSAILYPHPFVDQDRVSKWLIAWRRSWSSGWSWCLLHLLEKMSWACGTAFSFGCGAVGCDFVWQLHAAGERQLPVVLVHECWWGIAEHCGACGHDCCTLGMPAAQSLQVLPQQNTLAWVCIDFLHFNLLERGQTNETSDSVRYMNL